MMIIDTPFVFWLYEIILVLSVFCMIVAIVELARSVEYEQHKIFVLVTLIITALLMMTVPFTENEKRMLCTPFENGQYICEEEV